MRRQIFLQLNFLVVFFVNSILAVLPHSFFRVAWLRLWGKRVSFKSSIQRGLRISSIIGDLEIGDHSIIGVDVFLDNRRGIYIGSNVNISRDVIALTLGHDCRDSSFVTKGSPIKICDNAWLFMGVKIMPGVTIEYNSVIFSFSVVTKSTQPMKAYGGFPACELEVDVAERHVQRPYRFFCAF